MIEELLPGGNMTTVVRTGDTLTGNLALANHARMYRAHAEWLDNGFRSERV